MASGAAPVFDEGTIKLFARSASNEILKASLHSGLACTPGSCSFGGWEPLTGSPQAAGDPVAVIEFESGAEVVATRNWWIFGMTEQLVP